MEDKNSASEDTVKMGADDGKPNHVEDKENAMDGTTTNVIFFLINITTEFMQVMMYHL